ncbi:MAG TPA: translocation/assembly module TamB domain-containing protein [Gammaproteobacteria bacterium]|nr:translocation/assembly module TamB domain-containing protein [Gammaproteobacteria bacterium]
MRRGTKKGLIITGIALGCVLVVVIAAGAFLVTTQTGLQFVLAHAGEKIHVKSAEGSLLGPFTLRDVTLATDSADVHVDRITVRWSPGALFTGTLDVDKLTLVNVDVKRHPGTAKEPPSTGPPQLKPPIDINIDQLDLQHAVVHSAAGGEPFVIETAALSGKFTGELLRVRRLDAHGPRFDITGGARVAPGGDYATNGKLNFSLRFPGYAPAEGTLRLDGSLRDLQVRLAIAPPYHTQAELHADALAEPVTMRARLEIENMSLHAVHAPWPAVSLDATADANGTPQDLSYTLESALDGDRTGTIDIVLNGAWDHKIARIDKLAITRPASDARLQAAGRVDTRGPSPALALQLDWRSLGYPLTGKPAVTLPHGKASINGTLKQLDAQFETAIGKQGRIKGAAQRRGERFAINANWMNLRWPGGGGKVASPEGTLTFDGTLSHYQLKVNAQMTAPGQTQGHLVVRGNGDRNSIKIDQIDLKALQGELTGVAQAQWKPALDGEIHLRGHGINPGLLVKGWPGSLGLKLDAQASRQHDTLTASLKTLSVDGTLRGYPVALNAKADYHDKVLKLHQFALQSGPSHLSAQGRIGDTLNVDWRIQSPDLASLYPNAHGSLNGHGRVDGPRKRPHIVAALRGSQLQVGLRGTNYTFKMLNLNADVDLRRDQRSHLELALADGSVGQIAIHSVKLAGQGTLEDHHLTLSADTTRGGVRLAVTGGLEDQRWQFTLQQATLMYPQLAPWRLAQPSSGYVGRQAFALNKTCWITGDAKACVHAKRAASKLSGAFDLDDLAFAYFSPLTPPTVGADGSLSAHGTFERDGTGLPTVHVTAKTTRTTLLAREPGPGSRVPAQKDIAAPPRRVVAFAPSQIKLDLDQSGLHVDAALKLLQQQGGLFLTARIPGGAKTNGQPLLKRPLDAELRADIPDISFVSRFKPSAGTVGGRLEGTMHVRGSLAAPALQGRIALRDGSAQLPNVGLKLQDVGLVLAGLPDGGMSINGSARSGGGAIAIDGTANLIGPSQQADITISGDQFQALGNTLGNVYVSPDLHITLRGQTIDMTGIVKVPKANLTPKEIPQSAVGVSRDQVIIRPGKQETSKFAHLFNADIRLVLGDDVHFNGFGLTSRITGALEIIEKGNRPTRAHGELNLVDGEYRAYGQGLVIEQGTLLFAGPVTEPGLDVRAVRHPAENITVGVSISGTLKQPKFELFSDPPMTQAETLSWLVLGRPLEGTSNQQGTALSRLALGLGITQSNKIAQNLGENLGLDTFSIETGSGEAGAASNVYEAALVIGKYLSPRLYVSYGIGLFEPVNTVRLEYTLSSRWKLVTESSSIASGGDLIYTLETK